MRKKLLTLEYLREKVWWWQREEIRRDGVPGVVWDGLTKEAARNYELMRRAPGAKKFKKSYLELNRDERTLVHVLWCNWPMQACRYAMNKSQFNEKGWTPVFPNPPVQWNLKLADTVLSKAFLRDIQIARQIQGILPIHPLTGTNQNPVSWRYIEILDCVAARIGVLNDSDRHSKSMARKLSIQFLNQFQPALTEATAHRKAWFEQWAEELEDNGSYSAFFDMVS
jgi:hypothetical protein